MQKEFKISKRAYNWSLEVIDLCEQLPRTDLGRIIFRQLVRSATSVAANNVEADAALSIKDFRKCLGISLKECNESKVWLQYIVDRKLISSDLVLNVIQENQEIGKIMASILIKSKK